MHRDGAVCLILLYDRNLSIKNSIKIHVSLPVSFNCEIKSRVVARNRLYSLSTIVELSSSSMFVHSFLEHYNLLDTGSNLHDRPFCLSVSQSLSLDMVDNFCFHVNAQKSLSHTDTLTLISLSHFLLNHTWMMVIR